MKLFTMFCLGLLLLTLVCMTGCESRPGSNAGADPDVSVRVEHSDDSPADLTQEVTELPEGFVSVAAITEDYGDILWFESFEDAFCAIDLDDTCVWQGLFSDSDSIVKYEGAYYLEQSIVDEIVAAASRTVEKRQTAYGFGDPVPLKGRNGNEVLLTVEAVTSEEDGAYTTYVIRYSTKNYSGGQYAPTLFDRVETTDGCSYREFFHADTGRISIQIPSEKTPQKIFVRGEGLEEVRAIAWSN